MKAPVFVLEGIWETLLEPPHVLPYLAAYEQSHREANVFHRTFRNQADLAYYIGRIPKGKQAFVYVACHGQVGVLDPSDKASKIPATGVVEALSAAKHQSIAFLHFGCCEFVQSEDATRRATLSNLMQAAGAQWVSGYAKPVDWLSSMLVDLALISAVYIPWHNEPTKAAKAHRAANEFLHSYEQLARELGFSALSRLTNQPTLFPRRLI